MIEGTHVFNFNERNVGIVELDGEAWFVAKDVCRILGLSNTSKAIKGLDPDEKGLTKRYTPGGMQKTIIISESGLYYLLSRSDKPKAKEFSRWVRKEVLPSLRKNGFYGEGPTSMEEVVLASCKILIDHGERLDSHGKRLSRIESKFGVDPDDDGEGFLN